MNKFQVGEKYKDEFNDLIIEITTVKSCWIEYKVLHGECHLSGNGFSPQCAFARRLTKYEVKADE